MKVITSSLCVLAFFLLIHHSNACTVFVLNDEENAFYFANENASLTGARMWFIPGGEDFYAAVYMGFNGSAETGMNSEGLAFDWVAQFNDGWDDDPDPKTVRGNYGQRMIERCANVEEAIAFCLKYPHPVFAKVRPLIADKSGASAVIGVRDGKLFVDRFQAKHGMGTGFGERKLEEMLNVLPEANVSKGFDLLERCFERGRTPTRYSSVFDLKTGDIKIKHSSGSNVVGLQLHEELKLGAHSYIVEDLHMAGLRQPKPLDISMHRFPVDAYEPLEKQDPELLAIVERTIHALSEGKSPKDCTDRYSNELSGELDSIRSEFETLGPLQSVVIVKSENNKKSRDYLCRLEFTNVLVLQRIQLDGNSRIDGMSTEVFEARGRG